MKNTFKLLLVGLSLTCLFAFVPKVTHAKQYLIFSEQCSTGNSEAQKFFEEAQGYHFGRGASLNLELAKSKYSEAVANGSTRALYALATLKEERLQWAPNKQVLEEEILISYQEASEKGCPEATYRLYLWKGYNGNVSQDFPNPRLLEAAEGGAMIAMADLGIQYIQQNQVDEGLNWLKKAIDLGYGDASVAYSRSMFKQGRINEAMDALFSGAKSGSLPALKRLAWIYSRGLNRQVHDPDYSECLLRIMHKIMPESPPEPIPDLDQICPPNRR